MKVRIMRGAHEIGGSCVELDAGGSRIVLDVGKPLWAGWNDTVPLPPVPGLADGDDPSLAGVVISHSHFDHYGLLPQVDSRVPLYIGREAAAVIGASAFFSPAGLHLDPTGYLVDREPFRLGAFTITPYLVDHSAFDAYALLVEGEGRHLFYTGDIRGHGRKASLFDRLLGDPPRPVDVMLCEGTHLRPADDDHADEPPRTEDDVELSLAQRMSDADGAVVVVSSAQNIDRLVTVYRACKRAGRTLVTDLYTATVAHSTGRATIPQPGFPGFQVYVPNRQRVLVKESGEFSRLDLIDGCRVFPEELAAAPGAFTLLMPSSAIPELVRSKVLDGGVVAWSLWPGYLEDAGGMRLPESLERECIPLVIDHVSGHAPVADLQRLATALNPGRLVPIHTEASDRYGEFFDSAEIHADGEWWEV